MLGAAPATDPFHVLGHGFTTAPLVSSPKVVLNGQPQVLEGHFVVLLAHQRFVFVPHQEEPIPGFIERGPASGVVLGRLIVVFGEGTPTVGTVREAAKAIQLDSHLVGRDRVHLAEEQPKIVEWHPGEQHVEPGKAHIAPRSIVFPHPLDHFQHRLGVPPPVVEPGEQLVRIALTGANVAIHAPSFGPVHLHGEGPEPHLFHQETQNARLHLEEIPGAARVLPEGDDAGIADHVAEELDVGGGEREVGSLRASSRVALRGFARLSAGRAGRRPAFQAVPALLRDVRYAVPRRAAVPA